MPILTIDHLPRERVQAYLDDLAALSVRHGVVAHTASLEPRSADVGGYLLAVGGFLHIYTIGEAAGLLDDIAQGQPHPLAADIAGVTAHDLVRRCARCRDEDTH